MRVHSLTTRFLLAILLLTTVPFLVFGWYAQKSIREDIEQSVVRVYLPQQAQNAAGNIHKSLEAAKRAGWLLASRAAQMLERAPGSKVPISRFTELVESTYGLYANFQLMLLVDGQGRVLQSVPSPSLDAERHDELQALQPESVAKQSWFERIGKGEAEVWVDRHVSPYLQRGGEQEFKDPASFSLGMAFEVQMPDGSLGALFILLQWAEVQDVLDRNKAFLVDEAGLRTAEVFLCNKEGRILAHTDRQLYGDELGPVGLRDVVVRDGFGDAPFTTAQGQARHAGLSKLPPSSSFSWRIGLHATEKELFRESRAFGRALLVITALLAAFMSFWAWVSSRAILRPVHRLSDATRRVAEGDLTVRVDARGSDELGELSRAFNQMASDLSASQEKLREVERQAAWAEMARQVAHEIKNPLTPMRMGAQLLLKARREGDERWESLSDRLARTVIQQVDALDRIASDFRQFAGSPSHDPREVNVREFLVGVEELVASMAEASDIDIRFAMDGVADERCFIDREEMRRVFLNLIHNAIQACEGRGTVEVSASANSAEGSIEFRVRDDGVGVPEELHPKLFEPYFTTKTSGTGLGLAICRKIVEVHGGVISLASSAPGNTVFLVVLPGLLAAEGNSEDSPAPPSST